jgi:hypothetical protein
LLAYWGASEAEHCFASLKDPRHCAIHTPHHWTDQKLAVHTFMAVLGYTIMAIIRRRARALGFSQDARTLVDMLDGIRAARLKEVRTEPGRRRVRWQAEEADASAAALYRDLVLPRFDLGSITCEAPTRTVRTGWLNIGCFLSKLALGVQTQLFGIVTEIAGEGEDVDRLEALAFRGGTYRREFVLLVVAEAIRVSALAEDEGLELARALFRTGRGPFRAAGLVRSQIHAFPPPAACSRVSRQGFISAREDAFSSEMRERASWR